MLLLDKGYFDYDFEKFGQLGEGMDWIDTVRSESEIDKMMSGFGFGKRTKRSETDEELQNFVINQMEDK